MALLLLTSTPYKFAYEPSKILIKKKSSCLNVSLTKMKGIVILVFFGVCGLAYCRPDEKYTTKYDNVDLDMIIKNDRLLKSYIECVLGKRGCTKDGEVLKEHLSDALQTNCSKCSEAQKNGSRKVIRHLLKNKRDWWNELEAKFDPKGTYRKRYAAELKKEGIVL